MILHVFLSLASSADLDNDSRLSYFQADSKPSAFTRINVIREEGPRSAKEGDVGNGNSVQ